MAKKYLQFGKVLKKLLFDKEMRPIDLSRELNIPAPTIHRFLTSKSTRPHAANLNSIADYFSITVPQLVGEEPFINIQKQENEITEVKKNQPNKIPIIDWNITHIQNLESIEGKTIAVNDEVDKNSYALVMPDTSMEPMFSRGSILIFEPTTNAPDRSFILAQLNGTDVPVFRQLLIDVDQKYLKPLNPDLSAFKMRLLNKNDKIIAYLIESRHNFQQNHINEYLQET